VVLCATSLRDVLEIFFQRFEAVDFARQRRGDGRPRGVVRLGDFGGRTGRVGTHHALQAELLGRLAALVERLDVALHRAQRRKRGAARGQQMVVHALEMFAHDMQACTRDQMVDFGHAARERVFDRDHAEFRPAAAHGLERFFKARARQRLEIRTSRFAGQMRISARNALECDAGRGFGFRHGNHFGTRGKGRGVSGAKRACVNSAPAADCRRPQMYLFGLRRSEQASKLRHVCQSPIQHESGPRP